MLYNRLLNKYQGAALTIVFKRLLCLLIEDSGLFVLSLLSVQQRAAADTLQCDVRTPRSTH